MTIKSSTSKTMRTLRKLNANIERNRAQHRQDENEVQRDVPQRSVHLTASREQPILRNVIEYHPEEIDEFAPLRPEEADECALADLVRLCEDSSFLFESSRTSSSGSTKRSLPNSNTTSSHPNNSIQNSTICADSDDDDDDDDELMRLAKRARC